MTNTQFMDYLCVVNTQSLMAAVAMVTLVPIGVAGPSPWRTQLSALPTPGGDSPETPPPGLQVPTHPHSEALIAHLCSEQLSLLIQLPGLLHTDWGPFSGYVYTLRQEVRFDRRNIHVYR